MLYPYRKPQNLVKQRTRFVIARSSRLAISIGEAVKNNKVDGRVLFLTRDDALVYRNRMRTKYRAGYNVYEIPYREKN